MLVALYDIRSNRGVGHAGGDVNPNLMDATVAYGMASWALAELVRVFHGVSTQEAQGIADVLVERKFALIWDTGKGKRVQDPDIDKEIKLYSCCIRGLVGSAKMNCSSGWSTARCLSFGQIF